jgi:hypothetical protein
MQKYLNLVYEWIGPRGPLSNNRIPNLLDFTDRQINANFENVRHDLIQSPHFHSRIVRSKILPACKLPSETFLYELNFSNYHYRDLMRAFHHCDGLLDHNEISDDVLIRIKNKTAFFAVTLLYEGHLQDHFLSAMTQYFRSKEIPLTQIIYISNCYNAQQVYEEFCQRVNLPIEIKMEYLPVFRTDRTDIKQVINRNESYISGKKSKRFLCFNRRYNEHRVLFYTMMSKLNLLDHFYMSMAAIQPENSRTFQENARHFSSVRSFLNITEQDIEVASSVLPLTLDNTNFNSYPMETSPDTVNHYYKNSYINIINETYFFNNIIHLTEKTYKPIAYKQPFIMLAAPGSLKHIQNMGFKTFSEFWDESYDSEKDHNKRFSMLIELIKDIATWDDAKMESFSINVKPILDYNFELIKNIADPEIDAIVNKYGV